jgi:hypothetical protein
MLVLHVVFVSVQFAAYCVNTGINFSSFPGSQCVLASL